MPRTVVVLLVFGLCSATVYGADPPKQSPAVKRILGKVVGKVRANRTEFDKANNKPLDEARQELQDLSTKLIKDGKTEEAKAVLSQVGTLETDVMKMANAPAPMVGDGRVEPQKPLLERLEGKWDMQHWHVVIERDGSCRQIENSNGRIAASGQFVPKDAGTAEMKMTHGWVWRCSMPMDDDKLVVFFWSPEGQRQVGGQVLEQMK